MEFAVNSVLLTMMAVITIAIIRMQNLFGVVILAGVYSFLMASVFMVLDAVDVGMTEASVGAGISTVLFLSVLGLTRVRESVSLHTPVLPLFVAVVTGAVLVYGTWTLPEFGSALSPANSYVGQLYLDRSMPDMKVPNVVTSVLASYRGFDTFGEVVVVFTAGIAVLLLLRRGKGRAKTMRREMVAKGLIPDTQLSAEELARKEGRDAS
jgi:multicomponent Na+:H+ antiporter subunit B